MTLCTVIAQYVAYRKAAGADFRSSEQMLAAFCRHMGFDSQMADVDEERAHAFIQGTGSFTCYWHRKHSALLGFFRYALSRGYVNRLPLPMPVPKQPPAIVPYIYSHEEIRRLLNATGRYRVRRFHLEPHTLRTMILLLYGAGLRGCEAIRLTLADVNTASSLIVIRESKFYKTRLVPVGPDLNEILKEYSGRRVADHPPESTSAAFFVDSKSAPLRPGTVRRAFAHLRAAAGVRRTDGARYQPRLHDLRHSFTVNRLTAWYQEGKDVQRLLPALSTYIGHISLAATQVYLTMTPELLRQACQRFERYAFDEDGRHE